jgi:ribosomal protein S18 acetylase RimI-like enzyme
MGAELAASIRRLRAEEWSIYRKLRLRALADSPGSFGSTLELEEGKPDEHWMERVALAANSESQMLLLAELGMEPVGVALGAIAPAEPGTAHIYQMWVASEARGRGCATALLDALLAWARGKAKAVTLRVTCGDTAARRLYERAGFVPCGEPEPLRSGSDLCVQPMTLTFCGVGGVVVPGRGGRSLL